ncbi:hypothetical protein CONCODRAFT_10491 [Conidiobolus coronatus NRRL 28638]|uniref:RNI-like protein n=1 Tax=Conidiobolus coronatus (strain ATCC 28846 / CBS 209.66 / NRRL 28638) TaxID=796925 RepID=A0A137NX85_CONC2|nr:hypothetical protein CONCODRAFT_10491 [Conidiobolus coronatus NRRL 28638]|eukprot:KXN67443.1 hypothetical protein CONCODRAFT_10491 [Conidiobolus coronatus NRRL 28638]
MFNKDKKDNLQNLKWDIILNLHELQQYLTINDLTVTSLLNKQLRYRLKHKIYSNIEFNYSVVEKQSNYSEYMDFVAKNQLGACDLEEYSNFKKSHIDPLVHRTVSEIEIFSLYTKAISLNSLDWLGYYILPAAEMFNQLIKLEVYGCVINFKEFNHLLAKLNKLEVLRLYHVNFLDNTHDRTIKYSSVAPLTLKELSISYSYVHKGNFPSNNYQFLLNYQDLSASEVYYLPLQNLPSLKSLQIRSNTNCSDYLLKFLSLNTQLCEIIIPISSINTEIIKILANNNNISRISTDFYKLNNDFQITPRSPLLCSLQSFSSAFSSISVERYPLFNQIISLCPNLKKLDMSVYQYDPGFIKGLLSNLNQLSILKLSIYRFVGEEIDLSSFSKIESLKLIFSSKAEIYYKLPSHPTKLKLITISLGRHCSNYIKDLDKKYKNRSDWRFKILPKTINFYWN